MTNLVEDIKKLFFIMPKVNLKIFAYIGIYAEEILQAVGAGIDVFDSMYP